MEGLAPETAIRATAEGKVAVQPPAPTLPASSWLSRAPAPLLIAYGVVAGFSVYFCMYAFRKPFDAVIFKDIRFLAFKDIPYLDKIELKTACVIAQILGYTLSKYLGTRICSEVSAAGRAWLLIGLVVMAEFGLLLFAVLPNDWKPAAMLLNGLPLGMVWGLVVRYLEGRRSSEILVAGLSCSFIIAGAMTRDVGRDIVMSWWGVEEAWMPVTTGVLFFVPLLLAIWMLHAMPNPTAADVAERAPRQTMGSEERRAFLRFFGFGMVLLLVAYFFLTALRDFRDHYAAELFTSLKLIHEKAIFSQTEKWAMFAVILAMAGLNLIGNHRQALIATYGLIVVGFAVIGGATFAFQNEMMSGSSWMIWTAVGLYMAYVPFGAILFERMMAGCRLAGTAVFAILLADGVGYTGSIVIQLYRDVFHGNIDRLAFFLPFTFVVSGLGVTLMSVSGVLTLRRIRAAAQ